MIKKESTIEFPKFTSDLIFPYELWIAIFINLESVCDIARLGFISKYFYHHGFQYKCVTSLHGNYLTLYYEEDFSEDFLLKFINLRSLTIPSVHLMTDKGLKNLISLTSLSLASHRTRAITKISDNSVKKLTNLKHLNLNNNRLISDNGIRNLTNLTKLKLMGNFSISDSALMKLVNIQTLDLTRCQRVSSESLYYLTNITSLNLTSNEMIKDEGLVNLSNLKILNLSWNKKITDNGVKNLTNITSLNLTSNRIITGKSITYLTNISTLIIPVISPITKEDLKKLIYLKNLTHKPESREEVDDMII